MEVRCCCQPMLLLGWLPVPDDVSSGQIVRFAVPTAGILSAPRIVSAPRDIIELTVTPWTELTVMTGELSAVQEAIDNHVEVQDVMRHTCIALKSDHTPIERLRLIPGFVENHDTADVKVVLGGSR